MYAMTAEEARYMLNANEMAMETIVNAIKKYWEENHETIIAGLCAMNGRLYVPANR